VSEVEQGCLAEGHEGQENKMRQGSKVVCIDDSFPSEVFKYYIRLPIKNSVYVVRDIGVGVGLNGEAGEIVVYLESIENPCSTTPPYPERGFNAERFREVEPPAEVEAEELAEASA